MASPLDSLMQMEPPMDDSMPPPQFLIPPAGFSAPDEASGGKSFDVVARVKLVDGELQVEAINGQPLSAEMEMEEPELVEEQISVEEQPAEAPATLKDAMRASGIPM
jgi:hypothetical protein